MSEPGDLRAPAAVTAGAQRLGRSLVVAFNAAIRAVRLYPVENAAVQKAIAELGLATERVLAADQHCEIRCIGDQFFVNDTRLRLAYDNYAAVASLLGLFGNAGLGGVAMSAPPEPRAWVVLLSYLQAAPADLPVEDRLQALRDRLDQAQIDVFELLTPTDATESGEGEPDARERSRQTYTRSIEVSREVLTAVRVGRSQGLRQAKRAVQGIVDLIMSDNTSLLGMTAMRDVDEFTFVHSVNVCILSVALGRRLGFTKTQLLDLGLAALLHDIGLARMPNALLTKVEPLDAGEVARLRTHTWEGVLALFALPTGILRPWRAMTASYEHHLGIAHTGYPPVRQKRPLALFSKLIAVADRYDEATNDRREGGAIRHPADVLRAMRENPRLGLDGAIVKAFINLLGIYPVGSLVLLDTYELAVVVGANPQATALSRPLVHIIMDDRGNLLDPPDPADLTDVDAHGQYRRSILRTEDPERYAIRISDYLS